MNLSTVSWFQMNDRHRGNRDETNEGPSFWQNQVNSGRHFGPRRRVMADVRPLPTLGVWGLMNDRDYQGDHRFSGGSRLRQPTKKAGWPGDPMGVFPAITHDVSWCKGDRV